MTHIFLTYLNMLMTNELSSAIRALGSIHSCRLRR